MFTKLEITKIKGSWNGRQLWQLERELLYLFDLHDEVPPFRHCSIEVTIPKGFVTDFASVPRFFWRIFPPTGPWCEAAVLHDYLYQKPRCPRFLADALFREAMRELGVPFWRRVAMYYAVRLFGGYFREKV